MVIQLFVFRPVTNVTIQNILLSFKNKSCALELVPVQVFKYIYEIISPILCVLINKSIFNGEFPDSLKIARIVPLHKAGDRNLFSNYRPISILSTISKVFERAIHQQLYRYFQCKGMFFSQISLGFEKISQQLNLALVYLDICMMVWIGEIMFCPSFWILRKL